MGGSFHLMTSNDCNWLSIKCSLSESVFDDFNAVVLLVGVAFVLDRVNSRSPVTVLRALCVVDFDLQCRSELVTSVHLEKISRDKRGLSVDK